MIGDFRPILEHYAVSFPLIIQRALKILELQAQKTRVRLSQDDSLSAKLPCRGPFEASTRLQARGLLPSQLTRQIFVVIFGSESQV